MIDKRLFFIIFISSLLFCVRISSAQSESETPQASATPETDSIGDIFDTGGLVSADFGGEPTYIKVNSV